MAIKISNNTIIDDDRSIVNASRAGIGTAIAVIPYDTLNNGTLSFEASEGQLFSITNNLTSGSIFSVNDVSGIPSIDVDADGSIDIAPYGGLVNVSGIAHFSDQSNYDQDITIDNNKTNISLQSDIVIDSGKTLTVSTGSTIVLNPFDFQTSSVDELLVDKLLTVGLTSSFDVVTSGIASVGITSTRLVGFGTVSLPNLAVGLLVKEIPGVIAAGTTVVSFVSAGSSTGVSTVTISPASLNTSVQENVIFKFGNFGEEKSGIILDGETQTIKAGNNTVIIDGENNKITIGNVDLDASNGLVVSDGANERLRIDDSGRLLIGSNASRNTGGGINALLQVEGIGANSSINLIRNSNDVNPPYVSFAKSRGTTVGSASSVLSGDILGEIRFSGANNNANIDNIAARITAEVDGQPLTAGDTTDMPGRLVFYTTADGASSPTERMRITNAGIVSCTGTISANGGTINSSATTFNILQTPTTNTTLNIATNVSGIGTTKTINFGTGGVTGSTNNINIAPLDSLGTTTVGNNLTARGRLQTSSNTSLASWTTTGISFDAAAATFTDTSTAGGGTVATQVTNSFNTPSFASTNAITVTNASTVYIANRPTASTNTTITNGHALHIAGGRTYMADAGSATIPSLAIREVNTGLYSATTNTLNVTTGGVEALRVNAAQELLVGYTVDNGAFRLQVNSQIFATSATIATSDGRYKENVDTLDGCLNLVKALRPVSFTWKPQQNITRIDDEGNEVLVRECHNFPDGTQVGFIAQEVKEVLADRPWLTSIIRKNLRKEIADTDGNILAPEEEFYGIAEGNLIAVLTNALQETIAKIEILESKVEYLESLQ